VIVTKVIGKNFIIWQKNNPEKELERRLKISIKNRRTPKDYIKKRTWVMKFKCSYCGKEVIKRVHLSSKHKFCSRECYWKWKKLYGLEWRYQIVDKVSIDRIGTSDNFLYKYLKPLLPNRCEICGSDKNLEIHHKDGNRRNNSLNNLMVVCRSCHRKIDNRIKNIKNKTGKPYLKYKELYEKYRLPNGRWGKWEKVR